MAKGEGFIHGIDCPDHWRFPDWLPWQHIKNAVTDGQSVLAYQLSSEQVGQGNEGVVYFDSQGQPADYLRHSMWDSSIRLMRENSQYRVNIHRWPSRSLAGSELIVTIDPFVLSEDDYAAFAIVAADYSSGALNNISLGKCFDNSNSSIRSPMLMVGAFRGRFSFSSKLEEGYQLVESASNRAQILHDEKPEFECGFDIKSVHYGFIPTQVMICCQTHLDTGRTKIAAVPMRLDMNRIMKEIFVPFPNQAQINAGYNPSWRQIDRAINIQLTYK